MPNTVSVRTELSEFQKAWRASKSDDDVPARFHMERLDAMRGQYQLRQIYATRNYRIAYFSHTAGPRRMSSTRGRRHSRTTAIKSILLSRAHASSGQTKEPVKMDDSAIVGTVTDSIRELLMSDDAVARDYLKASFLSSAMIALFYARRKAGLTQAQVAERMGTKQSGIARMEADSSGSVSLHRYVEYALACDMLPLNMVLDSAESIREYALANPDADRSADAYAAWRTRGQQGVASPSSRQSSADPEPLLPESTIKEALDEAAACEKVTARATILKLLAPNLSPRTSAPLLEQALGLAQGIVDSRLRASTLFALAPRLPQPLQSKAKAEADRAIENAARQIVKRYA